MIALEMSLRGPLRNFGLKVGAISRGRFEARIQELTDGNPMLETASTPMLRARASLRQELTALEKQVRQLAQDDPVCCRLMTMQGIGAVVALTFRAAVDDPTRFLSSKRIDPWVGLTPSRNQSGKRDVSGGITKAGDVNLRRALCQVSTGMMNRGRSTWLRTWGAQLAERRGRKIARASHRCRSTSHLGRWHRLQAGCRTESCLTEHHFNRCLPDRRLSRSRRDVVPVLPWSGPSLTTVKHACEMGTSELHRTSTKNNKETSTADQLLYAKPLD